MGQDKFLCPSIPCGDGARERAWTTREVNASGQPAGSFVPLMNAKPVPQAIARVWICVLPFISAVALDVEDREQRSNDNKHCCIGQVSPRADPFSNSKC